MLLIPCNTDSNSSPDTNFRASEAQIDILPNDISLVSESDYIFSIVPPRDAVATAKRITTAFKQIASSSRSAPLYYLDLNAISPKRAREIAALFAAETPSIRLIDGGIIGGPPALKANPSISDTTENNTSPLSWYIPNIPLSGEHSLADAPVSGPHLFKSLSSTHISRNIGVASGLKCCFASTTKGFAALCIQSFTTAAQLDVLPLLLQQMDTHMPGIANAARGLVTAMPTKSGRWVAEMQEIAVMHALEGGFSGGEEEGHDGGVTGLFGEVAEVFRTAAEATVLGEERIGRRKRGLTVEDVADAMKEGLNAKRKKTE